MQQSASEGEIEAEKLYKIKKSVGFADGFLDFYGKKSKTETNLDCDPICDFCSVISETYNNYTYAFSPEMI